MEQAEVNERLKDALHLLCTQDGHLLDVDASERPITHRLGLYLQDKFWEWDVDCEYNREGHDTKAVGLDESLFDRDSAVYPDIIIHKRGYEGPNLLVIEVKKNPDGHRQEVQRDLDKLKAYKRNLAYTYAVFLKVWPGENRRDPAYEWL